MAVTMSSDLTFTCDKCPRTFKLQEFYDKHKLVHDLKKQHVCHLCGSVYGAAKGLEGHLLQHHDQEREEKKPKDGKEDKKAKEEEEDKSQRQAEAPTPCDVTFLNSRGVLANANASGADGQADLAALEAAAKQANGTGSYDVFDGLPVEATDSGAAVQNESGFFMCNICTREFSGLNSLKKHIPIHTRKVQHSCDVCGFVFGKKEYLLDHMRKHTGEVSPVCEVCGQTFNKSLKLKEHFKIHRNVHAATSGANPYQCHVCKAVFARAALLGKHLAGAHSGTVYKCDICEATFGDVRGKNHHMYNEHQLDAFHQKCVWCPVCNQGFTRHYNLKVHMYKSHGKEFLENNFTPAELTALTTPPSGASGTQQAHPGQQVQQAKQVSLLKSSAVGGVGAHYFDTKQGTQMLVCNVCKKKFVRKSDLYIHLDSDHGVALLGCASCDDKFVDAAQLREHEVGTHGRRRPGPASRTHPPLENRVVGPKPAAMRCKECELSFVVQRSYLSHMRVFHKKMVDINKTFEHFNVVDDSDEEDDELSNPLTKIIKNLTAAAERKACGPSGASSEQCNFCENFYDSTAELKDHVINKHIKDYNFSCDYCGKGFPTQDSMTSHTRVKHPNLVRKAQRDGGLKESKGTSKSVFEFLKVAGTSCNDGTSDNGNTSFLNSLNLAFKSEPVEPGMPVGLGASTHAGVNKKNTCCPICGVKLSPKTNLKIHLRTHSGARPYSCVLCQNRFRQKAHLMKHFRCAHNNKDPPFHCDKCHYHTASSNDLYHHIADQHHSKKTAHLKPGPLSYKLRQQKMMMMEENEIAEDTDGPRYEPIRDVLLFEDQIIHPCYVPIPFATEEEIAEACNQSIVHRDDEDFELTIDENYSDDEEEEQIPPPLQMKKSDVGMLNLSSGEGFYPALSDFSLPMTMAGLWKRKAENLGAMNALQQLELGEKVDKMQKYNGTPMVEPESPPPMPRLPQTPLPPQSILLNNNTSLKRSSSPAKQNGMSPSKKQKKSMSPNKSSIHEDNAAVQAYETQLQDELWPVECIKCTAMIGSLESFNKHMNDHWSDDKCCPVCGLLINSKRFNFKQHLKIHTGEKPFVCKICQRSFRQKAHMVKHVTTHRGVAGSPDSLHLIMAK